MGFNIYDENDGMFKIGNIITVFELPGVKKKIALFSSEDLEGEDTMCFLNVAYLEENAAGECYITDIEDMNIQRQAIEAVSKMLQVAGSKVK